MNKEQIKKQLLEASQAYYEGNPIMTDGEYDEIFDSYKKKYPNDVIIGYKPSRERSLPIPMFSLNKYKTIEEVVKWVNLKIGNRGDVELILMPKYDGISLCVDEFLSPEKRMATTRGDGTIGQQCDMHYSFMNTGDSGYEAPMITFGEAIMSKKAFAKYDKSNGGMYKNARNLVGSQINADKPVNSILKDIDYIRYGFEPHPASEYRSVAEQFIRKSDQLDHLNTVNTVNVPYRVITVSELTHDIIIDCFNLWNSEYELDGVVIEFNRLGVQKSLGREISGNPAYSRAYKGHFENSEITEVQNVVWQVSKHGKLKPVVQIESVRLSGVDVTNVTGYNARNIIQNKIGKGAIVSVKRSGAVIPKIVDVHNPSDEKYLYPLICPECSQPTELLEVELMCNNNRCSGTNISLITAFFEILKCKEVGRGTIEAFWNNGYYNIFTILSASIDDIKQFDKYGEKKATKVFNEIHACLNGVSMADLKHASGCFKDIGSDTIQAIEDGESKGKHADSEYKIGINSFNHFYETVKDYVKISGKDTAKTNKLAGITVVYTGFRDASMEKIVQENGGKVGNSVNSKTTHLVMAMVGSGTVKEKKALELGIAIMTGSDFTNYISSML